MAVAAAVVLAGEAELAARLDLDVGGAVRVLAEGAAVQDPEDAAPVVLLLHDLQPALLDDLFGQQAAAGERLRVVAWCGGGRIVGEAEGWFALLTDDLLDQGQRHRLQAVGNFEDAGEAVPPAPDLVTLLNPGAVDLPDPCGVVHRGVELRQPGVETPGQAFEEAAHQVGDLGRVGQVHAVEEVAAVAAVAQERCRKALARQVGANLTHGGDRGVFLHVGGRDPRRADGVTIDGEPDAAGDVGVGSRGPGPALDAVVGTGQQVRVDGVQGDVDGLDAESPPTGPHTPRRGGRGR